MGSRPTASSTVQIDNERTTVTEWRFPPGGETGWHRHAHDYVVVPVTGGELLLESADGTRSAHLKAHTSYFRGAGVEHNVVNDNDFEFMFVEIELKQ